jgi:NAD(P)-dependent dehydrogenase (short-subunit alcohol dehydrogenase family)
LESRPTAFITGCSTGIGFETALLLARQGYRVFATMRNLKKSGSLRKVAQGLPLEILALDVDKPASVKRAVAAVLHKAGRVDVLVNNAGWGAFGAIEEFSDEEILAQYETNVFGLVRVTREVLPAMRKWKAGRIINISSLAGRMTFAGIGLYCATKHAVESFTESLRLEVRPFNIEVAVVEPGTIQTPFKTNRRLAGIFLKGKSAYQKSLEGILHHGNNPPAWSPGPKRVASVVLKALRARRMAVRYPVGMDAVWLPFLRWFMPDALYDWVLRFHYAGFQKEGA